MNVNIVKLTTSQCVQKHDPLNRRVIMTKGGKAKRKGYSTIDILLGTGGPKPSGGGGTPSKKINNRKVHHDSLKGGGGNNTGRRGRG